MQKEINKLLKQLQAAKLRANHKDCAELNNIIGGLYSDIGSYEEAVHHHEEALDVSKTLGDRLGTALCHRHIGEARASLGQYDEAIKHIKTYVELTQKINDKVEIQRAWTTLGRIYLMQAQSLAEGERSSAKEMTERTIAREAEKHFQTALNMAESVRHSIDDKEYSAMIIGLLINMAIIKDIRGMNQEAIAKFNRAAEVARNKRLREDLYRCCAISAPIYRRWNDTKMAVKASEEALRTAKSIGRKVLICEALIEVGFSRICQRDFKNAKRSFAQAYLEKSPSEDDHIKAIKLTKLAHLISTTFDKLSKETTASETRIKLCDKLGDLFVAVGNYHLAAEYYKQAFVSAKACSLPNNEMARFMFSVAECFADSKMYDHALFCYKKEAAFRQGNPKEQSSTYIKIAHMMEYLDKSSEDVCQAYEKALENAGKDPKLIYNALRWYVPYLERKSHDISRIRDLQEMLTNVKSYPEVVEEIEEEDYEEVNELEDEIANVDDVITDDEENDEVLMIGRRRAKGNKFKQNEVGDTPLHEASIKGDLKRVKSLISQGHEVNPRDNAGWIPLHESCNHGHYQIAEYLIEQGADVNYRGLKGVTPLHDAATNGHYEIMRLLIKNGANVLMLTDTGENVLTCLRDYKSRNYSTMSNSEMSEYKQMEAELLNIMDKCGHSLMSEGSKAHRSTKPSGSSYNKTDGSSIAPKRPQVASPNKSASRRSAATTKRPEVALNDRIDQASRERQDNAVKDYRHAMGTLKRKRPLEVTQPSKKASQPATIRTNYDPSLSTKNWLLKDDEIVEEDDDDDDEDEEDVIIAAQRRGALKSDRRFNSKRNVIDDDDEDEVLIVGEDVQGEVSGPERVDSDSEREPTIDIFDDDYDHASSSRRHKQSAERSSIIESERPISVDNGSSMHPTETSNFSLRSSFDLFNKPLVINIDNRKLLIPIKDENMTIRELKDQIAKRYSLLVNAQPIISLAPKKDTACILFDDDLCRDVIREDLNATVTSWHLPSIVDSYSEACMKLNMDPITLVKAELRVLDDAGSKLSLSHVRFPKPHRQAVVQALSRRGFTSADFQGSVALFETQHTNTSPQSATLMDSIITCSKLTRLNLKCTGLLRLHFEQLCNAQIAVMPELQEIDVSYNSILYKEREDFSTRVESLRKACPNLKRLNISKNLLNFVDQFAELNSDKKISDHIDVIL